MRDRTDETVTLTMADMPAAGQDGLVGSAGGPRADRRRRCTVAYKMAILAEYDQLTDSGERGALLRREGLYHSQCSSGVRRVIRVRCRR
jgi:hypothetical protein